MIRGLRNETLLPIVVSDVSEGKSSHYYIWSQTTSHYQFTRVIILEKECIITKLNGSQFEQIYKSIPCQSIHSQILHENSNRMQRDQTEVISNWSSLFIILIHHIPLFNSNEACQKL